MDKEYHCCMCDRLINKNKRLVYQEYDGKKPYGVFHNKRNFDICDKCFIFVMELLEPYNKMEKEKKYERNMERYTKL